MAPKTGPKKVLKTWLRWRDLDSSKRPWDAQREKVCVDIHVQAAGSQICLQNICGQQRNSPMADPIFGSKYGPQNGVQNLITISFLLLGLCLGPVLGSRFGPKSGASHRKILLLPADVLQADLRRTSMSVSVNTCFFSLCVPICFLYSSLKNVTREHQILSRTSQDFTQPTSTIKGQDCCSNPRPPLHVPSQNAHCTHHILRHRRSVALLGKGIPISRLSPMRGP